jgi:hypothetical protein
MTRTKHPPAKFMSRAELARRWNVSVARVTALVAAGTLAVLHIPATRAFTKTTKISLESVLAAEKSWTITHGENDDG